MLCGNRTRDFVQGHRKQVSMGYLASLRVSNTDGVSINNGIRFGRQFVGSHRVHPELESQRG